MKRNALLWLLPSSLIALGTARVEARDILRGGGSSEATSADSSSVNAASVQAAATAQRANDVLLRTTQALQAMRAAQDAARKLAVAGANNLGADPNHSGKTLPDVSNGLAAGGLVPDSVLAKTGVANDSTTWQNALTPVQTTDGGKTTVTITQTAQQALLYWQTFNIGKNTTLVFDQSAGGSSKSEWIAFNKINDPTGVPSQILGSIQADGQVYLINQNGIIFGGSSQVNVHTLVASSLPINDNLVSLGLLNNPDAQFLFSALTLAAGSNGTPSFTPSTPNTPDGKTGDVTVQAGAVIESPLSSDNVGGRVALIGANVTNEGTISTPNGQTILAAGLQVGMAAHSSSDTSLRGLDVYVGAVADPASTVAAYAGTATNGGIIDAERGDITITGKSVNQFGVLDSTTSVSLNGRIDLLAQYNAVSNAAYDPVNYPDIAPFLFESTGAVTLGVGSVTRILPETASTDRVVSDQWTSASASQVNIQGLTTYLASGAEILAPNATVTINAGVWDAVTTGGHLVTTFVYSGGQIYLDAGAAIDVAGSTNVTASVSENIISAELLGTELADSVLQRSGILRGKTVTVDVRQTGSYDATTWVGTPLADLSGYVALITYSVGELTTDGGTVSLNSGESVVLQAGSRIDVSGGWINYKGARVQTTRLISGGHLYDMSEATPDLVYSGIYEGFTSTHSRWNVTETFTSQLLTGAHYETGYVQGGNGGTISITATSMALDGSLYGTTVTGPRQRTTTPDSSSLSLKFESQDLSSSIYQWVSPTPPNIVFQQNAIQTSVAAFSLDSLGNPEALEADRVAEVVLSPDLVNKDGFGNLEIDNSDGNITVPANVSLTSAAGGSITLAGANIDIEGKVTVPSGSLTISVYDLSPSSVETLKTTQGAQTPNADLTRGLFILGAGAFLSTAGLIVDDRAGASEAETLPLDKNGGTITIKSYSANFEEGSVIDVSGGLIVSGNGKRSYGKGGSLVIKVGQDLNLTSLLGGHLTLNAALEGYGGLGQAGGKLTILAPLIQIGGTSTNADTLLLSPDFFSQGGFCSFTLNGLGTLTDSTMPSVYIAPGTVITPVAQSLLAQVNVAGDTSLVLTPTLLPQESRTAVSLTFGAAGLTDFFSSILVVRGDFVMGEGAVIQTDPEASVTISGNTVAILGHIIAPGGSISISGGSNSTTIFGDENEALPTVDLGPTSVLSTAGTVLLTTDVHGYHTGSVLDGGSITVSGNIVAEAGARLDVSGASDTLDLLSAYSGGFSNDTLIPAALRLVATKVDSDGGSITLKGAQELFTDATLVGAAGGSSAEGGSLSLSSGIFTPPTVTTPLTPLDVTLVVTQSELTMPTSFYSVGETAIGNAVLDANGNALAGRGYFAADRFLSGGFDSLTLQGTVEFSGPVTITANSSLTVGSGGVIYADAAVNLKASYVALGTAFASPGSLEQTTPFLVSSEPYYFNPTYGTGSLTVSADLIDIGNLSLQNIGAANFVAADGDIRGDGTLDVAGVIRMTAGQIYPPTECSFTIAAYDYLSGGSTQAGSVTILASGERSLPYSAGGTLNIYGSIINQGGVLRAPLGSINLGWDGVGTGPTDLIAGKSVEATQFLMLSRGSVTSVSAIDLITGEDLTLPYGLNLNGTSWIDPSGIDITSSGLPAKSITISAVTVDDQAGSVIDIRGGGDLYAYRWVSGTGGTKDILASNTSFAIIPGYSADYAPYAAYNTSSSTTNLGTDTGYTNSTLSVGDRIYLDASGLPAGYYTLLPARYALLAGAYLVTPLSGTPTATTVASDGASIVSGYISNGLNSSRTGQTVLSRFEVASQTVVKARAQYDSYSANTFFKEASSTQRLPEDSGRLVLEATQGMVLQGSVISQALTRGRGGWVDISSPVDILIAGSNVEGGGNTLVLNASDLDTFGAESLLIGGVRSADGTVVSVQTNSLTVDNAGTALTGQDIVFVANQSLTLAAGADIESAGSVSGQFESLVLGNSLVAGSGDGLLLRVSSDSTAQISRAGVSASSVPTLTINAGVKLVGTRMILDSTHATLLDPTATLRGDSVSLNSGQISIQLDHPGALGTTAGLIMTNATLQTLLSGVRSLSLLSYSSIDLYGTGQIGLLDSDGLPVIESLSLHAGEIRGFNNDGGAVTFNARSILLDNRASAASPGVVAAQTGQLVLNAEIIKLGANQLNIDQFAQVTLNATGGILFSGEGGLAVQGGLTLATPLITGATGAVQTIIASGGALVVTTPTGGGSATLTGGVGATLTLEGSSVAANSWIQLSSGLLTLHATSGDVSVGGRLDVAGTESVFDDLTRYTSGGELTLTSDAGNVELLAGGVLTVAAQPGGGDAGSLTVSAPTGVFHSAGTLLGQGGVDGDNGAFSMDVGAVPGGSIASLNAALNVAGFTLSRTIRVRTGDVLMDGIATASSFNLSADAGSITVAGTVDSSGAQGGTISLEAGGSVSLSVGSLLTVAAQDFSSAGKGGSVSLETRGDGGGVIDIGSGSVIDLSVASNTSSSAANGDYTGTLHLRAPQTTANTDLLVNPINGSILNASNIIVEGFHVFDLTSTGGAITAAVEAKVLANGQTFLGAAGTTTTSYMTMLDRLLAHNTGLASVLNIEQGAEIINQTGDLTLASTWDLATYRYGPNSTPGVLTLRAVGNLNFNFTASLSDGFDASFTALWQAPLLSVGSRSWSYRLIAGADFTAADFRKVKALASLAANTGSLLLGNNSPALPTTTSDSRESIISNYYQTIRTGSGDIDIYAGRDVQILNPLGTIYTAGSQAAAMADFDTPVLTYRSNQLGSTQSPVYGAQYSMGGGNVTIWAQNDIARYSIVGSGTSVKLVADSTKEMPSNWLYRRGYVDSTTGLFSATHSGGEVESTSWWIDFSNFFEGVGALGGGNVTLIAGHDVSNVDAVVPTNARMSKGTPNVANLLELGGGDLVVKAGHDIDGGVYYVERGHGTLSAGNSIHTNSTRAALTQSEIASLTIQGETPDAITWLPTTLFLGKGSFDVSAGGDVLLGPVANAFLLPQGINNSFYEKSYFSTYASTDAVNVTSLTGDVTLKDSADGEAGSLESWYQNVFLYYGNTSAFSRSQPWLRLVETNMTPFATVFALMPGTLSVTAFSEDINIVGSLTLSPSSTGSIDLIAAGSINGLQINGVDSTTGEFEWSASTINLSDADPSRIPGVASPLSLASPASGFLGGAWNFTPVDLMDDLNSLFNESGSTEGTQGVLQTKQALHAPGVLHANDTTPVHLYALTGDISGFTLFSGKSTWVIAGRDITDIALYLQNTSADDVSLVSAGRDLIAYDPNSLLRVAAQTEGNVLSMDGVLVDPLAGDIQIGGPGTLEVLAGRNLDLGVGSNRSDGTAVGITSIGNARNPYLPDEGADIVAGAGIGSSSGLDNSSLDFTSFIAQFLDLASGGVEAARYLPELGTLLGLTDASNAAVWAAFEQLPTEKQDRLALEIFYLVLRDAGRDYNTSSSSGYQNYNVGYAAIKALFPGDSWQGNISLTSREIKTLRGGNISLFAPGGALTVGYDLSGNQPVDQGILTEDGGNISIFARDSVTVGTSRIFTLRGGNEIIWSTLGDIAAGASSKTVQSAPPTRVLIDPQSGDVQTDLAGLATGGGIGVLDTVSGVTPGDVDLIAPAGNIDAGDAGIRASGNLNVSALAVLNSSNIQVGGASVGTPVVVTPSINLGSLATTSSIAGATNAAAEQALVQPQPQTNSVDLPTFITVEVIGYGGGEGDEEEQP
jgi:filamentous hemagglutinin family protein